MTTRDPKKNSGREFAAAERGEDVGIASGADIISLREAENESSEYARREYGATADQVSTIEQATDRRYRQLKRSGKLVTLSAVQIRSLLRAMRRPARFADH